jgi:polyisoprenoid-binding protein YceI
MMRRCTLALALVACLAAGPRPAVADDYKIDDSHTSVIFGISHMGLSYTYGRFNKVSGTYTLDAADPAKSAFKVVIDANSVDTNNQGRDNHLRGPDFFNAGEFPLITFESTKVVARQDGEKTILDVTGNMTMHGVTKEITLALVKLGEKNMGQEYRSGFLCDAKLMRSEFGMSGGIPNVGDEVAITISFEGVRQ